MIQGQNNCGIQGVFLPPPSRASGFPSPELRPTTFRGDFRGFRTKFPPTPRGLDLFFVGGNMYRRDSAANAPGETSPKTPSGSASRERSELGPERTLRIRGVPRIRAGGQVMGPAGRRWARARFPAVAIGMLRRPDTRSLDASIRLAADFPGPPMGPGGEAPAGIPTSPPPLPQSPPNGIFLGVGRSPEDRGVTRFAGPSRPELPPTRNPPFRRRPRVTAARAASICLGFP